MKKALSQAKKWLKISMVRVLRAAHKVIRKKPLFMG